MIRLSRGMLRALSVINQQEWRWHSNHEITQKLRANERTIRRHTKELAARGLVREQRLSEGHVYMAAPVPAQAFDEVALAAAAYGMELESVGVATT